ncbi:MAG TPA: hypothetical protein VGR48_08225 [Terriglobales bacterium]|nr:hypothetical protein [Terriglobales bacterium]
MNASRIPTDLLELQAAEQRRRLHNSVAELRVQMREKLDLRRNARRYFWPATVVVGLWGLVVGYGLGGILTRD